jgi:TonB family protein
MPANQDPELPDVFSAGEIARAAGVHPRDVFAWAEAHGVAPLAGGYFDARRAVPIVRHFTGRATAADRTLFEPNAAARRKPAGPILAAGAVHAALLGLAVLVTSMAMARPAPMAANARNEMRLVFQMTPGPGGGGGGGGRREPDPPPPARVKAKVPQPMRSPVPIRRPPPRPDPPRVLPAVERPPVRTDPLPPVVAPVVPVAADTTDRPGLPVESRDGHDSSGSGTGGGAGSGIGTGLGEGDGPGIGAGSGGGTGGGPYRPGSGVTPPSIVREVKPDYTEEGRRRGIEGDVVMEIVVRSDGSVGAVTLLQGLGAGLDQRAIDAVRQWRFTPAHRFGAPVDVIVEVAVEFKLR